jgi:hypothetical protein
MYFTLMDFKLDFELMLEQIKEGFPLTHPACQKASEWRILFCKKWENAIGSIIA